MNLRERIAEELYESLTDDWELALKYADNIIEIFKEYTPV